MLTNKIAFFTEGDFRGKFNRNYPDARTDIAWQIALGSDHFNIRDHLETIQDKSYTHGIIIVPKRNPRFEISQIKRVCDNVYVMQEGPHWYWQDWSIHDQFAYMELLQSVDAILVHNEIDKRYYSGLGFENVFIFQTLMIEDCIPFDCVTDVGLRNGIMIGGNFVSWYSGMDSFVVASLFDGDQQIYAPSMGRKQDEEISIDRIEYLPYINWSSWMRELSKRKVGVHLMRTFAAGTFALNCARLSIPCIGYIGLDTQTVCHPHTSVEIGDIGKAKNIITRLYADNSFYSECAASSFENYTKNYSENVFMQNFSNIINA